MQSYDEDTDWAELRFNGPVIDQLDRTCFYILINVDILLTIFSGGNDAYRLQRFNGIFQAAFTTICVYKYGDGPDDDQTFLFPMKLSSKYANKIRVTNFGLILPDNKFVRSTIESDFEAYFP